MHPMFFGYGKFLKLICFLLFLIVPIVGGGIEAVPSVQRETYVETAALSSNSIGVAIYKEVMIKEGDALFSPLSLTSSIAMLYAGATDISESQISRIMHFGLPQQKVGTAFGALLKSLETQFPEASGALSIKIGSSLWLRKGAPLLDSFKDNAVENYRSAIQIVDFKNVEPTRTAINNWIRQSSGGKVQEILSRGEGSSSWSMLLISTFAIRGKWKNPFDLSLTQLAPFFPSRLKTVTVPMMNRVGNYFYVKKNNFSMLELPYEPGKGGKPNISMLIVLPEESDALGAIEEDLNVKEVKNLLSQLREKKVALSIPKFSIKSFFSFKKSLIKIGLTEPFSKNRGFSSIDGTHNVQLDDVWQKTSLSIDEKGSDSTGLSAAVLRRQPPSISQHPIQFTVNHPFMFLIIDRDSSSILLIGHIFSPFF